MKASTPESGFVVNLNAEQKELFKIAQKYGWNRQKLLDNAQKEIDKAGLGISKDTLRKRFDRLSEKFKGVPYGIFYPLAGVKQSPVKVKQYILKHSYFCPFQSSAL